jgi:UDP-N-acetylmuramyl pentapeptide phosphotransferase/UDP-N-acetylglucosamine-1-phosphate transferase
MIAVEVAMGLLGALLAFVLASPKLGSNGGGIGMAVNHRGAKVRVNLWFGLLLVELAFAVSDGVHPDRLSENRGAHGGFWLAVGVATVFLAGYADDRWSNHARGLREHLRALVGGRPTTGALKLAAAVAASSAVALAGGGSLAQVLLGVPLIAGMTNLFNLLDVAPGRSLKFGLLVAVSLTILRSSAVLWATIGACLGLLPWDLRERGMLGDAGSNVLGFVLGVALYDRLSTAGMAIALALILALHALAETVTLSRIIDASAPLRGFDRLGRLPRRGTAAAEPRHGERRRPSADG